MTIPILAVMIRGIWLVAEWIHALSHKAESAVSDKCSRKVWDIGTCVGVVGVVVGFTEVGRIETGRNFLARGGIIILLAGLVVRWMAIYTLGKYFTRTVTITSDHRIVRKGLYKHLRHPSYTGSLLALAGLGMAFANWLSFVLIFMPILAAALYRMHVEEDALRRAFGGEYTEYVKNSKRLVPKVY